MRVDLFSLKTVLHPDTRIPGQYPGNGDAAVPFAFELAALMDFINANIQVGPTVYNVPIGTPSVAVAAGKLIEKIVVIGTTTGTFKLGTTPGGTEILDGESFDTDGAVFAFDQYFHTAGSLYFSGFTGTLTVKIYAR